MAEPGESQHRHSGDLLRASRSGDRQALEALLCEHLPGLRAFVRLRMSPLMRARETEEDLVQSACCELLLALDDFEYRGEESFRGWLYTSVLNKLKKHERDLRAQRRDPAREVRLTPGDSSADGRPADVAAAYARALSPTQTLMSQERVAQLEAAFDGLPDEYREILTLARFARLGRAEIAVRMGRTEAAVRSLLMRARAALAHLLDRASTSEGG